VMVPAGLVQTEQGLSQQPGTFSGSRLMSRHTLSCAYELCDELCRQTAARIQFEQVQVRCCEFGKVLESSAELVRQHPHGST
jgi:hypothetical protein